MKANTETGKGEAMANKTHQVVATVEHDCYEIGDIISRHETWGDAEKATERHNALYVWDIGLVCQTEDVKDGPAAFARLTGIPYCTVQSWSLWSRGFFHFTP